MKFGTPQESATIAAKNLDPMYQDEYILGMQSSVDRPPELRRTGIYRKLKAAIDDNCDYTADLRHGRGRRPGPGTAEPGFPYCRMFNPGEDTVFVTDIEGNGMLTEYTVPGELLSPEAKRSTRRWNCSWTAAGTSSSPGLVHLAKSKGNTEGGVKSDIGQADTNVTQDFDYSELAVDYVRLPAQRPSPQPEAVRQLRDQRRMVRGRQPAGAIGPSDQLPRRAGP